MSNIITPAELVQQVQTIWSQHWKGIDHQGTGLGKDAFPQLPGQLLLGGIRGYEHGKGWTENKRNQFNDTLFWMQVVAPDIGNGHIGGWKVGMARGTTDPGVFKKVFNPEGDMHLMCSRIGGPYWARVGRHHKKPAFKLFDRGVISRTRKGWQTGDPYDVEFRTVKNLAKLGADIHYMDTEQLKRQKKGKDPIVGMYSAGCQGAAKVFIDEMLAAAAEAKRICGQTVFAYVLLEERDFIR